MIIFFRRIIFFSFTLILFKQPNFVGCSRLKKVLFIIITITFCTFSRAYWVTSKATIITSYNIITYIIYTMIMFWQRKITFWLIIISSRFICFLYLDLQKTNSFKLSTYAEYKNYIYILLHYSIINKYHGKGNIYPYYQRHFFSRNIHYLYNLYDKNQELIHNIFAEIEIIIIYSYITLIIFICSRKMLFFTIFITISPFPFIFIIIKSK